MHDIMNTLSLGIGSHFKEFRSKKSLSPVSSVYGLGRVQAKPIHINVGKLVKPNKFVQAERIRQIIGKNLLRRIQTPQPVQQAAQAPASLQRLGTRWSCSSPNRPCQKTKKSPGVKDLKKRILQK